jgi:dihydrofolate reductase
VISRQKDLEINGVEVCDSLQSAISLCKDEQEIFIIGGAQIFEQSLDMADTLYLTVIQNNFFADTFFPEIDKKLWKECSNEPQEPDEKNIYYYNFKKYDKI